MQPRPLGYEVQDKLKVVVIMTDGENWEEWRMRDAFKTGQSEIWHTVPRTNALRDEIIGMHNDSIIPDAFQRVRPGNVDMPQSVGSLLSVRRPRDGRFYHPDPSQTNPTSGSWMSANFPVNVASNCTFYNSSGRPNLHYDTYICNNWIAYRVSYPWLWHNFSVRWVAQRIYNLSGIRSTNNFVNDVLYRVTSTTKDQRLFQICDLLKTRETPIFTVAFEAPPNGVAAMRTCATSPNHFFDVQGTRIRDAFRTIAGNIQNLRLVQ